MAAAFRLGNHESPAEDGELNGTASWRTDVESNQVRRYHEPSLADLFREEDSQALHAGDLRRGIIRAISPEGISVSLRGDVQGFVPMEDVSRLPDGERAALRVGQEVLVYVTSIEDNPNAASLSLYLALKERDWLIAERLLQDGRYWEGRVGGYNKGGLVVPFGHIRGFVPTSQITGFPRSASNDDRLARLAEFVGQELAFKVVEVDRRKRRLVLSERLGRQAQQADRRERVLSELRRGDLCRGRVRSMTSYGAFVDLDGMVGLIHRTELAWFRVEHPSEILQEGQEVEAYVLRVNRERGRVSLSLKRTYPDPWKSVTERYQLGQTVEGRIIRQTGAGLFLLMDDGVLGFISAAALRQSGRPAEALAIGQRMAARLVRIDGARRRLGLALPRERTRRQKEPQEGKNGETGGAESTTSTES